MRKIILETSTFWFWYATKIWDPFSLNLFEIVFVYISAILFVVISIYAFKKQVGIYFSSSGLKMTCKLFVKTFKVLDNIFLCRWSLKETKHVYYQQLVFATIIIQIPSPIHTTQQRQQNKAKNFKNYQLRKTFSSCLPFYTSPHSLRIMKSVTERWGPLT